MHGTQCPCTARRTKQGMASSLQPYRPYRSLAGLPPVAFGAVATAVISACRARFGQTPAGAKASCATRWSTSRSEAALRSQDVILTLRA